MKYIAFLVIIALAAFVQGGSRSVPNFIPFVEKHTGKGPPNTGNGLEFVVAPEDLPAMSVVGDDFIKDKNRKKPWKTQPKQPKQPKQLKQPKQPKQPKQLKDKSGVIQIRGNGMTITSQNTCTILNHSGKHSLQEVSLESITDDSNTVTTKITFRGNELDQDISIKRVVETTPNLTSGGLGKMLLQDIPSKLLRYVSAGISASLIYQRLQSQPYKNIVCGVSAVQFLDGTLPSLIATGKLPEYPFSSSNRIVPVKGVASNRELAALGTKAFAKLEKVSAASYGLSYVMPIVWVTLPYIFIVSILFKAFTDADTIDINEFTSFMKFCRTAIGQLFMAIVSEAKDASRTFNDLRLAIQSRLPYAVAKSAIKAREEIIKKGGKGDVLSKVQLYSLPEFCSEWLGRLIDAVSGPF